MKHIIPIYIIKEILPSFLVNLLVFTFILLMAKVLQLTELIVVRGVKTTTILNLLWLSLPFFLSMTIPMSTLLAVLMAFLRMSGDNEITVLKSAGVGLYQLIPPVLLFSLWTYLLTSYLTLSLVPAANWSFRLEVLNLAKARADVGIKERVFNADFKNMVIFVNHVSIGSDMLEDIFIQDERDPEVASVIVASRGRIATDPDAGVLVFQLLDGVIDRIYKDYESSDTIHFQRYELKMNLEGELGNPKLLRRNQSEMTNDELWQEVDRLHEIHHKHYEVYLMDAHKRFSLPVACLVLGLVAVPLGVAFRGRGRNWGLTMGLVVFLIYYVLLSAGWSFGESEIIPPALAMWLPNIVIGIAAIYMIQRVNKEAPIKFIIFINRLVYNLRERKRRRGA